jgi:hypothetical protein
VADQPSSTATATTASPDDPNSYLGRAVPSAAALTPHFGWANHGRAAVSEHDALVARLILQAQAAEDDAVRARNAQQSLNELVASQRTMIQVGTRVRGGLAHVSAAVADQSTRFPTQNQKMILKFRDATIQDYQKKRPLSELKDANRVRRAIAFEWGESAE